MMQYQIFFCKSSKIAFQRQLSYSKMEACIIKAPNLTYDKTSGTILCQRDIPCSMLEFLERWIFKSWWIVIFSLCCFALYERGVGQKSRDFGYLQRHLLELQDEYAHQVKIQEDLHLQINSQSDPDWLELVLMRGLGLVPEKQKKVFFTNHDTPKQVEQFAVQPHQIFRD